MNIAELIDSYAEFMCCADCPLRVKYKCSVPETKEGCHQELNRMLSEDNAKEA